MNRKKTLIICALVGLILIIGVGFFIHYQTQQKQFHGTPLAPVRYLVSTLYFNQGTYQDYREVFLNKSHVIKEQEFNSFKYRGQPDYLFPIDYDSVDSVMKHMKEQQVDANTVKVYWVRDLSDSIDKAKTMWTVVNQNGKWYIKN